MARYRIRLRPNPEILSANVYEVEECMQMTNKSAMEAFDYWSFVDKFDSFEDAKLYVEACLATDCVIEEY